MKRFLSVICCIFIMFAAMLPSSAAGAGTITVTYRHEEKAVVEADFKIYRVAGKNDGGYILSGEFSAYKVELGGDLGSEELKAAASTLSAYAARDNIQPLAKGKTDGNGVIRFGGLPDGLYLLVSSPVKAQDELLISQPMLVPVPFVREDGTMEYDIVTEPKYDISKTTGENIRRRAVKIWKDNGNETGRPENITVQLLCDGKIHDEQTLNEDNNWSYTWNNLEAAHDWQLTEKEVPENYTVEITQDDMTFTVTNTNDNPPPEDEPRLPATGLLWWPVPVLAIAGTGLVLWGIYLIMRKMGFEPTRGNPH